MANVKNVKAVEAVVADDTTVAAPQGSITTDILERRAGEPDKKGETPIGDKSVRNIPVGPNTGATRKGIALETKTVTTLYSAEQQANQAAKAQLRQEVAQALAEANDLYEAGDTKHSEAKAVADKAAIRLYHARTSGALNVEEMNATLRDIFGAKKKGSGGVRVSSTDPEASKTPFGKGEDIRKRVVRAEAAFQCAIGNKDAAGAFFDGLDKDSADKDGQTIQDVLDRLQVGELSIWSAYDYFAAIKRNQQERTNPAFDPGKVSAMVEALNGEGASDIIEGNPSLKAAYNGLMETLLVFFPVVEVQAEAA